ncbi:FGGY carbohydrate kinase domain-containing protein isoform X2 [Mixophyes fleayi]|uniref:FGGY carbohydrate kinase domain-containing protein isoform X2 n=1 Tax=Mixophyes fleayi TaxID=3061075 RepID=UPI003F4D8CED
MWMDHRAGSQVDRINGTKHEVLNYVGGGMSVEMQPPKLLWLKENLRLECWDKAGHFFDLPDFLTWKATGTLTRSLCTLVCKWTYSPDRGWDDSFWKQIGLEDIIEENFAKIGNQVVSPGSSVGNNLTSEAARDLGLPQGIAVAASLIDAHAGGLGVIGADVSGYNLPCENQPITSRLALICGTSSCHMAISENPIFVPGVWGPYYSAMVPGFWLNEGGQSATGKLIDHVVQSHDGFRELQKKAEASGQHVYTYLNHYLDQLGASRPGGVLAPGLHVWPDFHGNRSPLADVTLKGMVVGLTLSKGLDDLALLYLATIQSIAACQSSYPGRWSLSLWALPSSEPAHQGISHPFRRPCRKWRKLERSSYQTLNTKDFTRKSIRCFLNCTSTRGNTRLLWKEITETTPHCFVRRLQSTKWN